MTHSAPMMMDVRHAARTIIRRRGDILLLDTPVERAVLLRASLLDEGLEAEVESFDVAVDINEGVVALGDTVELGSALDVSIEDNEETADDCLDDVVLELALGTLLVDGTEVAGDGMEGGEVTTSSRLYRTQRPVSILVQIRRIYSPTYV